MKILVTGAGGFIGAAIARRLCERGDEVVGIDSLNDYYDVTLKQGRVRAVEQASEGRFRFAQVDFADAEALDTALAGAEFDSIVHLGAQAGVRYSLENPRAYIDANILGHLNMLEVARRRGGLPVVYASSSSVYGESDALPGGVEDRLGHPVSLYAATKRADELISETYGHLHRIPLTGLRFFTVYGPWGRPDMAMWLFTDAILAGRPVSLFNQGEMWRDFTYIDDIVGGVLACVDNPPRDDGRVKPGGSVKPHAIYNIGTNRSEKLTRVIGLIEEACGRKARIEFLPMQPGDVEKTRADVDAIRDDLGYNPSISIDEGIPRFVEWFRRYHGV